MKTPLFDHEKLDVYQLELAFVAWATKLLKELKRGEAELIKETSDHLDRASVSALLNTAEGNGKRRRQVRAKFFDDARGSATECAGCLDALVAKEACTEDRIIPGKEMLVRIVQMLTKLVDRHETGNRVMEEGSAYKTDVRNDCGFEDEDESEGEDE